MQIEKKVRKKLEKSERQSERDMNVCPSGQGLQSHSVTWHNALLLQLNSTLQIQNVTLT